MTLSIRICILTAVLAGPTVVAEPTALTFKTQEIESSLKVGYAVLLEDLNGDKKPDIIIVDTNRVVWYENPTWKRRTIIGPKTRPDNVCITALDITGDGQLELVLGAGWKPFDTQTAGTFHWLERGKTLDDEWTMRRIPCDEPMVHRVRAIDLDGDGKKEIVHAPLIGRDATKANNWMDGRPVRVMAYKCRRSHGSRRTGSRGCSTTDCMSFITLHRCRYRIARSIGFMWRPMKAYFGSLDHRVVLGLYSIKHGRHRRSAKVIRVIPSQTAARVKSNQGSSQAANQSLPRSNRGTEIKWSCTQYPNPTSQAEALVTGTATSSTITSAGVTRSSSPTWTGTGPTNSSSASETTRMRRRATHLPNGAAFASTGQLTRPGRNGTG